MTASDYCTFLNQEAVVNARDLYNPKMAFDAQEASLLQLGRPRKFHYVVIAGRENKGVAYVSPIAQEAYNVWQKSHHEPCSSLPVSSDQDAFLASNMNDFWEFYPDKNRPVDPAISKKTFSKDEMILGSFFLLGVAVVSCNSLYRGRDISNTIKCEEYERQDFGHEQKDPLIARESPHQRSFISPLAPQHLKETEVEVLQKYFSTITEARTKLLSEEMKTLAFLHVVIPNTSHVGELSSMLEQLDQKIGEIVEKTSFFVKIQKKSLFSRGSNNGDNSSTTLQAFIKQLTTDMNGPQGIIQGINERIGSFKDLRCAPDETLNQLLQEKSNLETRSEGLVESFQEVNKVLNELKEQQHNIHLEIGYKVQIKKLKDDIDATKKNLAAFQKKIDERQKILTDQAAKIHVQEDRLEEALDEALKPSSQLAETLMRVWGNFKQDEKSNNDINRLTTEYTRALHASREEIVQLLRGVQTGSLEEETIESEIDDLISPSQQAAESESDVPAYGSAIYIPVGDGGYYPVRPDDEDYDALYNNLYPSTDIASKK